MLFIDLLLSLLTCPGTLHLQLCECAKLMVTANGGDVFTRPPSELLSLCTGLRETARNKTVQSVAVQEGLQ